MHGQDRKMNIHVEAPVPVSPMLNIAPFVKNLLLIQTVLFSTGLFRVIVTVVCSSCRHYTEESYKADSMRSALAA